MMKALKLDPRQDKLIRIFAALGSPARIRILEILAEAPNSIVADLVSRLPLAQATISQHLKVLQDAGLIHDERGGAGRCCLLNYGALADFAQCVVGWTLGLAATATGKKEESSCTN
ncbi:MAG: metalloregulator ArsR/SmtB family transcription factor [Candidatus Bipolaricaulis sp.]|nr:metalloregulator ArsR/SmtB family transcription factor [Candidatus Bipolaricaulis sp.]